MLAGVALAALISLYASAWDDSFALAAVRFAATVMLVTPALMLARLGVDRIVRVVRRREPASRAILVAHRDAESGAISNALSGLREFEVVEVVRLGDGGEEALDVALASVADLIEHRHADTVVLWTDLSQDEFIWVVDLALASGCRLLAVPRTPGAVAIRPKPVWIDGHSFVQLAAPSLRWPQFVLKRVTDLVLAGVMVVVLAPLLFLVAAAIRLDSAGPSIFRQPRVGRGGRPFTVWKFRTMGHGVSEDAHRAYVAGMISDDGGARAHDSGSAGEPVFKLVQDARVTRVGRLLRRTSLDELPQLFNVLRGEMSLVGPRPPLPYEVEAYEQWQFGRLGVLPGITGLWQVSGRNRLTYRQMCELDVTYVERWSLWLDLKILLKTVPVVLFNSGKAA
ncbi:MAG: exopolysaccharide biosynthesis polyprenyl glycosylphosphotransferase [Gemmatimonadales bacterium]|nr:exopolysaccharide biosynthesis polyprenyl glycosylphosphotransferase [Gemmatimonadales bacterium]